MTPDDQQLTNVDGLYLDDLTVGDTFITAHYTVEADEIVAFAAQYDPQPFHLDAEKAKDTYFGGLAASGWHTAALTMRLIVTSGLPFADGIIGAAQKSAGRVPPERETYCWSSPPSNLSRHRGRGPTVDTSWCDRKPGRPRVIFANCFVPHS
jgi:hypothetical protein